MGPANRYRHAADPDGQRIAADGSGVQRFNHYAFIKAEVPKPARLACFQRGPVDDLDAGAAAETKLVER